MIPPDRLNPFQFWAGDRQGKGRGARAVGPLGGGRTGNAPAFQEQGREQAQRGLVSKAGPAEGHWILQVNQEGGKAFGSAPNQAKPGAPASWGGFQPRAPASS